MFRNRLSSTLLVFTLLIAGLFPAAAQTSAALGLPPKLR